MSERKVEYTIYIKASEDVQSANSEAKTPEAAMTSDGSALSGKKQGGVSEKTKKAVKAGIAAYHYAKQLIAPVVANQINTISLRTGNDELQRRTQFGLDIVSAGMDVAEFALTGAILGGGVGAAVGTAVGVASKLISYQTAYANQQLAKTVESVGLAEARIRAGTSGDRIGKSY